MYDSPDLDTIRNYCEEQINTLWDEVLRFENPHRYYVDLSKALWDLKEKLLQEQALK
ncbi:MAG: pncB2 [Clostridia bacterium]|nr:pncB2 [Clostridia bacterium]